MERHCDVINLFLSSAWEKFKVSGAGDPGEKREED